MKSLTESAFLFGAVYNKKHLVLQNHTGCWSHLAGGERAAALLLPGSYIKPPILNPGPLLMGMPRWGIWCLIWGEGFAGVL